MKTINIKLTELEIEKVVEALRIIGKANEDTELMDLADNITIQDLDSSGKESKYVTTKK